MGEAAQARVPWYLRAPMWFLGCLIMLGAGLLIGYLLMRGATQTVALVPPADLPEVVDGQRAVNRALKQRVDDLAAAQQRQKDKPCDPDTNRSAQQALGPDGQAPPPSSDPAKPGQPGQPGQAPGQSSDQPPAAGAAPPELAAATVLVLGKTTDGKGFGVGTGFFIDKTLVLTNGHVVEDLDPSTLTVSSRLLSGGTLKGQLVKHILEKGYHGRDYAVLRVPEAESQPHGVLTLAKPRERETVIAAGFPASVLEQFHQLGGQGLPPLYVQTGTVVDVVSKDQTDVVWHTARIAKGDSGGPLVDACNRAIGLNTFLVPVKREDEPEQVFYFAKAGGSLTDFLKQAGITISVDDTACTPGAPKKEGQS